MDGEEFIFNPKYVAQEICKKSRFEDNEYEIITEFTYSESFPFKGQAILY